MAYLLRLVLPDEPGMLGAVATALGQAGADIVSLDVVERGPDGAVDDVVVELPPGGLVDRLITAAQSVRGVAVESLRPYAGAADLHRDLELVESLSAEAVDAPTVLAEQAPGVFRAGWALVLDGSTTLAASPGAPDVSALTPGWLPLSRARQVEAGEAWVPRSWQLLATELAVAPLGSADRVVLLGRPGGPRFRRSEILRLGHLAAIAASVTSMAGAC